MENAQKPSIEVFRGTDALNHAAAKKIASFIQQTLQQQERATLVLTGGKTPAPMYALLSQPDYSKEIDWRRLHIFWGDVRCVPPEHSDSNFGMAWNSLLSKIPIPLGNIHRMPGELANAEEAAALYESEILQFFPSPQNPSFTITLVGMGDDGHIASLFPGASWDESRLVVATRHPESNSKRISMTLRLLNQSEIILFFVSGSSKSNAVREVVVHRNEHIPASRISPVSGNMLWMIDSSAAEKL